MDKIKDSEKFINIVGSVAELFNRELTSTTNELYFKALQKYSIEILEKAFSEVILSCKFFPKPVEIIELIEGKKEDIELIAEQQAAVVTDSIAKVGVYNSVKFEDAITNRTIQSMGGWIKICSELKIEDLKWFRIEFRKLYLSFKKAGMESHDILTGFHEIQNLNNIHGAKNNLILIDQNGEITKQIED